MSLIKWKDIYHIEKSDLEKAGIVISGIDPQTIKIFNQDLELPIYVYGEKDGQFEKGDYIKFYGKFNRGGNSYFSPYSISNVYWLTWDRSKGLRMAEVDGGLYEKDSTKIAFPSFYKCKGHFEEDLNFDRLLLVSDESRDHWF